MKAKPRRKVTEYTVTARYVWHDADGVEHVTDEAGLPPEFRGPDGRPRPPAGHPVWKLLADGFYEACNKASPMSRAQFAELWKEDPEQMAALYRQWLGVKSDEPA